jgi:hypothetical protein
MTNLTINNWISNSIELVQGGLLSIGQWLYLSDIGMVIQVFN